MLREQTVSMILCASFLFTVLDIAGRCFLTSSTQGEVQGRLHAHRSFSVFLPTCTAIQLVAVSVHHPQITKPLVLPAEAN